VDRIEDRADFSVIRYANCWEDAAILLPAFRLEPGRRVLSIASAGDNSLAMLASGAEVVAVDLNPAQLACVELRRAAIRVLEQQDCIAFLGLRPHKDRRNMYLQLAPKLPDFARAFWDAHPEIIRSGVIHAGRFECYFQIFRRWVLPLVHGRRTVRELLLARDPAARRSFYDERWCTWRWRLMFRLFFSRFVMGRLGRDPEFFRYVDVPVAERIFRRAEYALKELSTHDNPFLSYILEGNFATALPLYLERETYAGVQANLERLTVVKGAVHDVAAADERGFDAFNLSDIFEYLDPPTCRLIYGKLLAAARPGARLAYWNMLAPRRCPEELAGEVEDLTELSRSLFAQDRAAFYSDFVVEQKRG
jgi:S-adenosylmethionine-diacylglycerol 3-amino-3-carboxypropyl transferase